MEAAGSIKYGYSPEMKKDFICVACNEYCLPPFRYCANSHTSCNRCMTFEALKCRLCKARIDKDSRNIILERYQAGTLLPCRSKYCPEVVMGSKLAQHIFECEHLPRICPVRGSCTWRGPPSQYHSHCETSHPLNTGRATEFFGPPDRSPVPFGHTNKFFFFIIDFEGEKFKITIEFIKENLNTGVFQLSSSPDAMQTDFVVQIDNKLLPYNLLERGNCPILDGRDSDSFLINHLNVVEFFLYDVPQFTNVVKFEVFLLVKPSKKADE